MDTREIIELLKKSERRTPIKMYIKTTSNINFPNCKVFNMGGEEGESHKVIFGDWKDMEYILDCEKDKIIDAVIENDGRYSICPLLDKTNIKARIEPGAIIRNHVAIGDNAIIMMGAIINIGAVVGSRSMIDMGAILGARAIVGENCHVGAGAVLAGVLEPPGAQPVEIGNNVVIGANAVILEGCKVGTGAVVGAGAVVTCDIPENAVVIGVPARIVKIRDQVSKEKTEIVQCLREI